MVASRSFVATRSNSSTKRLMREWSERPQVAHLINPAFCCLLLREFVRSYASEAGKPPDFSLLFIALPLVLHGDARRSLPKSMATRHHAWLESNQWLRIGFVERCRGLVAYVKQALLFGYRHGLLEVTSNGQISVARRRSRSITWGVKNLQSVSELLLWWVAGSPMLGNLVLFSPCGVLNFKEYAFPTEGDCSLRI